MAEVVTVVLSFVQIRPDNVLNQIIHPNRPIEGLLRVRLAGGLPENSSDRVDLVVSDFFGVWG